MVVTSHGLPTKCKTAVLSFNLENKTVKKKLTVGFSFILGGGGGRGVVSFSAVSLLWLKFQTHE